MVDADTKVYPDSLKLLTYCLINDPLIMGLCGETKIANKRDSWVTGIQVFEYYISHHLGKGFESMFGGVTCLPGCFCMYRLKAPKGNGEWVPIITKPEIVQEYSQSIVETLHQKNLLLLGEDRFLTTLMLRNFPNRKMMFLPQAVCKTVVPDEFSVLLSQRRRWINSTIHNLLELVLVRNLCGTFCFSMQFVIFMELIGTVVLPVAICMTFVLIVNVSQSKIDSLSSSIPLVMLIAVLFTPAILIVITSRKMIYVAWMVVYLIALPVWNFVLPVYSYWHFDDFSWGATRQVEGEAKGEAHGGKDGDFDASKVSLRRWEDYERRRRRFEKRQNRANAQTDAESQQSLVNEDDTNAYQSSSPNFSAEQPSNMAHYDMSQSDYTMPSLTNRPTGPRPFQ
ncbi:Chitin synthase, class 1 [Entomophthora muscae]|uniref:Chitin synthase, class 1 n=1 Tax=Entomophthora muscae TaxID=34485 RepID=A0ACC2TY62_9FUNG|nr:Chitin synthase, class 1 [Entomophthora muscae]